MPIFAYEVLDRTGAQLTGKMESEHEISAAGRLRKMGYIVLELNEIKESPFKLAFGANRKVKLGELAIFSRQLAAMMSAGIPLTRCLDSLAKQTKNPTLAGILTVVSRNVEGGMSLSESLRAYQPGVFTSMYVDMIKAGEMGGHMEEMLQRLSEQLEREKSLRDNIRSATTYPTVVLVFAVIVVLALMFFIVPVFVGFFPAGATLPLPTRIVMGFSNSLRSFWYIYLLVTIVAAGGLRAYLASESGQHAWDRAKFRLPVFGDLFIKVTVARFCRTLATLLTGGIPVLQALDAAGPASGSFKVAEAVKLAGSRIQQGQNISVPLEESGFFPPMVINMVAVGEETGDLSTLLARVATFYEEEVATTTKALTSLIEPLMIVFVGLIIGVIVISVYLPIFSVVTNMGG